MMVGHLCLVTWLVSNQVGHDQPTSPMPFRAADQRLPTSPMVKLATNRLHRWNRPRSADWGPKHLAPVAHVVNVCHTLNLKTKILTTYIHSFNQY